MVFWTIVGWLLLVVIEHGIAKKKFNQIFLKGLIILLAKKGDPTLITNKRSVTLQTVKYKIGAKAFHGRLMFILMKIISAL